MRRLGVDITDHTRTVVVWLPLVVYKGIRTLNANVSKIVGIYFILLCASLYP